MICFITFPSIQLIHPKEESVAFAMWRSDICLLTSGALWKELLDTAKECQDERH